MDARADDGGQGDRGRGERSLDHLRLITQIFDQAFAIPGTTWRFGLDALFGLVPGLGDIAGALVAVYAMRVARQLNAPPAIQLHMLSNIALDALVGMVPIAEGLEIEARAENLTDARVVAGISGAGIVERATPRTLWIGLRWGH